MCRNVKKEKSIIKNRMEKENFYDDSLLPENFEQMANAYAQSLKNKGFVFIRLEEEEFNLLLGEIFVLFSKILASLKALEKLFDSARLQKTVQDGYEKLCQKFGNRKTHQFRCVENETMTFLGLVSIENLLIIKLMLLSIKSGEFELCNQVITDICSVFAESFCCEGFVVC